MDRAKEIARAATLPPPERAALYSKLADEAIGLAREATDEKSLQMYFNLARCWRALAAQFDQQPTKANDALADDSQPRSKIA